MQGGNSEKDYGCSDAFGLSVRIFQSSGLRSAPFVSVDLTIPDHKGIEVWRKVFFDMLGNVWEWTCSEYKGSYDGSEQKCAVSAEDYSLRGGSWSSGPGRVRAAYRSFYDPDARHGLIGFRLAQD